MDLISLQKVDESNFIACFDLKLGEGQEKFVSHPVRSLAQAYVYYKQCTPLCRLPRRGGSRLCYGHL